MAGNWVRKGLDPPKPRLAPGKNLEAGGLFDNIRWSNTQLSALLWQRRRQIAATPTLYSYLSLYSKHFSLYRAPSVDRQSSLSIQAGFLLAQDAIPIAKTTLLHMSSLYRGTPLIYRHALYSRSTARFYIDRRQLYPLYRHAIPCSIEQSNYTSCYTDNSVVSLMRCKVKLDRISTTAGCCISLSMAKRENWVKSSTCTRNK